MGALKKFSARLNNPSRLARQGHLDTIHVLRGIAAASVMLCHLTYANENFATIHPAFSSIFSLGYMGVWAFFVISGFVIPHAMAAMNYQLCDAGRFLLRRIVRLEPAYAVSVFLALAIAYAATLAPAFRGPPVDVDWLGFVSQFFYAAPWVGRPWINGVAWTLAIEFQYYVLMLFVGPLLISRSPARRVAFFVMIAIASVPIDDPRLAVFRFLPDFAMGFSAFLFYRRDIGPGWFAALLLAFAALIVRNQSAAVAVVALGSVAFIFVPMRRPIPALAALGSISYSLYLVSSPIGTRVVNLAMRADGSVLHYAGLALAIAASVGVAAALWRYVERPSQLAVRRPAATPADFSLLPS